MIRKVDMTRKVLALGAGMALVLAACSGVGEPEAPSVQPGSGAFDQAFTAPAVPVLDPERVGEGKQLYGQYCAACHRLDRSGDPNWKTPDDAGIYPPPPHDDTGHTWHHPDDLLSSMIKDGVEGLPSGMPQFRGTLTDDEIVSILEYFKSEWGDEERAFQWQVTWQTQQ